MQNSCIYGPLTSGYIIRNSGCGLISASDVLLYLALHDSKYSSNETDLVVVHEDGTIYEDSYIAYVLMMNLSYFCTFRWLGVPGTVIGNETYAYGNVNNMGLKAYWCVSGDLMLDRIKEMINNDIPVTFSIGPSSKEKLDLLICSPVSGDEYNYIKQTDICDHYVTITGLLVNGVKGENILEVSSWGEKFYIRYEDYKSFVENYAEGGYLFSNIVYISKGI